MSDFLTTTQVMKLLGVSYFTLDKFRRYRELPIPFGRYGRRYGFDRDEVLQWLKDNALLDPIRPLRPKLDHERRPGIVVAGTSRAGD